LSSATFVALFIAALVIWFIVRVVDILLLVFIAILLAVYLSAVTDWLERRFKVARYAGLTIAVVATVAAVTLVGVRGGENYARASMDTFDEHHCFDVTLKMCYN